MIIVDEMPKTGRFVVVWTNINGIWCESLVWKEGVLFSYDDEENKFIECSTPEDRICGLTEIKYIVE